MKVKTDLAILGILVVIAIAGGLFYRGVSAPTTNSVKGCYVGGCSAQLCTDEPNAMSSCEYTAAYACYRTAKCERQTTGQCGWTQTPELKMCLNNAQGQTIY